MPSLRNVSKSAPYFHDGSVATLAEAVKVMATGGIDNKNKTPLMADRGLSEGRAYLTRCFPRFARLWREALQQPDLP